MGEEQQQQGGGTPWGKIILISCVVILVLTGGCIVTVYFVGKQGLDAALIQMVQQARPAIMNKLESDDARDKLDERWDKLTQLANDKKLSTVAGSLITNAQQFVLNDKIVSDSEAEILLKYFDIIIEKDGNLALTDPANGPLLQDMQRELGEAK